MPIEKQPDSSRDDAPSISRDALDWSGQFIKHLTIEFESAVGVSHEKNYSADDLRRLMTQAFVKVLIDSGASLYSAYDLLDAARLGILGKLDGEWTDQKNERRIALIDKSMQQDLSPQETFELFQLTEQLRCAFDTEEFLPIDGPRKLIEELRLHNQGEGQPD